MLAKDEGSFRLHLTQLDQKYLTLLAGYVDRRRRSHQIHNLAPRLAVTLDVALRDSQRRMPRQHLHIAQ